MLILSMFRSLRSGHLWPLTLNSCNWLGGHASVLAMDWYGKERINSAQFTNMTINGQAVAAIKNVDNFSFARVYNAGHEVVSCTLMKQYQVITFFHSPPSNRKHHLRYSAKLLTTNSCTLSELTEDLTSREYILRFVGTSALLRCQGCNRLSNNFLTSAKKEQHTESLAPPPAESNDWLLHPSK